jgi:enamine deaminase RidA (YjgF/YER057c/UK114 family)
VAKKSEATGARTRRQVLTAGLTGVAATAVAGVQAATPQDAPQAAPPAAGDWTPKKEAIRRPGHEAAANPLLSSCIRSGHLLFLAGIGGWYPDRRKEPGDITVQIQSALTSMKETLEYAGSSMANVLKVHMTVADPNQNLSALNEAYRGFFPDPPPVRSYSGAGVDQMGREGVLVQIDCIAYVD